jgi:hypothetical protein
MVKDTFYHAIIAIIAMGTALMVVGNLAGNQQTARYNCSIAEISPDIPIQVKEMCRKANAEAYRKVR